MKLTKYEHACLVLEEAGEVLVIDPGVLAKLPELSGVTTIVITHVHPDHLQIDNLAAIIADNPSLTIYASDEVIAELDSLDVKKVAVANDTIKNGVFELQFFGHDHAVIYEQVPCQNRGVMVNNWLYYPGDSFTAPGKAVKVLAFPAAAPWCKVSEVVEFIERVKPARAFPTHNGTLSEFGEMVNYFYIEKAIADVGGQFVKLEPGDLLPDA